MGGVEVIIKGCSIVCTGCASYLRHRALKYVAIECVDAAQDPCRLRIEIEYGVPHHRGVIRRRFLTAVVNWHI